MIFAITSQQAKSTARGICIKEVLPSIDNHGQ